MPPTNYITLSYWFENLSLSLMGALVCYISYRGNMVFLHSVMVTTRNLPCQHWEVLSGWELALKRLEKMYRFLQTTQPTHS